MPTVDAADADEPELTVGQLIYSEGDVSRLPPGSVLLCREGEVFWLPGTETLGWGTFSDRLWLAAGYDPAAYTWPDDQVARWSPLRILHIPTTALAD